MKFLKVLTFLICIAVGGTALAQEEGTGGHGQGGNGGFADESAKVILKKTSQILGRLLSEYSSEAALRAYFIDFMGGVPKNFDRQDMIYVLTHIKEAPKKTKFRDGRELLFDYGYDENGRPYIVAYQKFYMAYLSYTQDQIPSNQIMSLAEKLLHEYSHFWGYDDKKAISFRQTFIRVLQYDEISCNIANNIDVSFQIDLNPGGFYSEGMTFFPTLQPFDFGYLNRKKLDPIVFFEFSSGQLNDQLASRVPPSKVAEYKMADFRNGKELTIRRKSEFDFDGSMELVASDLASKPLPLGDMQFEIQMDRTFLNGTAVLRSSAFKKDINLTCKQYIFSILGSDYGRQFFKAD